MEAADLVGAMVRREPARRLRIAEVLGHVHWLGASEKLRRVCLLADTRPEEWDALRGAHAPEESDPDVTYEWSRSSGHE